jgi:hypothetical protein
LTGAFGLTCALASTHALAADVTCQTPALSPFWQRLDELCVRRELLEQATFADPALALARDQLVAHCASALPPAQRPPPDFAAMSDELRMRLLVDLGQAVGVPESTLRAAQVFTRSPSALLELVARRAVPDQTLRTGAGTGWLVGELVREACDESGGRAWLPQSCTIPATEPQPLIELRRRAVMDVVHLGRQAWARSGQAAEAARALRLVSALLDTAFEALDFYRLAEQMARDSAGDVAQALTNPCASRTSLEPDAWVAWRLDVARRASARTAQLLPPPPGAAPSAPPDVPPAPPPTASDAAASVPPGVAPGLVPPVAPAPPSQSVAPVLTAADPVVLAGKLLQRLLADGPELSRPDSYYQQVLRTILTDAGRLQPGQPRSPVRAEAGRRLLVELRNGPELSRNVGQNPADTAAVRALVLSMVRVIDAAMTLVDDRPYSLPPEVTAALDALLNGQLSEAARLLASMAPPGSAPPPEVLKAIELTLDFLRAPDDDARQRVLRGLVLGLPPWTEPILFDLNVGTAVLASNDFRFAGDLTLGYNAGAWGVAAEGYLTEYDLTSSTVVDETSTGGGSMEAWYAGGGDSAWRWEGRFVGGGHVYDTQTTRGPADVFLLDQTSILARGSLLAGLRYQTTGFAAGLWLGGGGQYEWYDPSAFGFASMTFNTNEELQAEGAGRLRLEWHVWPEWIAVRARVNATAFRLTRAQTTEVFNMATNATTTTTAEALSTQVEVSSRLFLDAEVATVFGFVPGINAGLDYVRLQSGSAVSEKALPVLSAGVRREVF